MDKDSLILQRHLLGSIDLSDIKDEEMTEAERRDYCAAISAVFPRIEKDIKKLLYAQLMYSSNQAEDWEKVIFGRGTFNGLAILLESWRQANSEHLKRTIPEDFNKHDVISDI